MPRPRRRSSSIGSPTSAVFPSDDKATLKPELHCRPEHFQTGSTAGSRSSRDRTNTQAFPPLSSAIASDQGGVPIGRQGHTETKLAEREPEQLRALLRPGRPGPREHTTPNRRPTRSWDLRRLRYCRRSRSRRRIRRCCRSPTAGCRRAPTSIPAGSAGQPCSGYRGPVVIDQQPEFVPTDFEAARGIRAPLSSDTEISPYRRLAPENSWNRGLKITAEPTTLEVTSRPRAAIVSTNGSTAPPTPGAMVNRKTPARAPLSVGRSDTTQANTRRSPVDDSVAAKGRGGRTREPRSRIADASKGERDCAALNRNGRAGSSGPSSKPPSPRASNEPRPVEWANARNDALSDAETALCKLAGAVARRDGSAEEKETGNFGGAVFAYSPVLGPATTAASAMPIGSHLVGVQPTRAPYEQARGRANPDWVDSTSLRSEKRVAGSPGVRDVTRDGWAGRIRRAVRHADASLAHPGLAYRGKCSTQHPRVGADHGERLESGERARASLRPWPRRPACHDADRVVTGVSCLLRNRQLEFQRACRDVLSPACQLMARASYSMIARVTAMGSFVAETSS